VGKTEIKADKWEQATSTEIKEKGCFVIFPLSLELEVISRIK
jgi:hypothetical protein